MFGLKRALDMASKQLYTTPISRLLKKTNREMRREIGK